MGRSLGVHRDIALALKAGKDSSSKLVRRSSGGKRERAHGRGLKTGG
jgi:hypothetical protein